jgi:hypothetical protein
MAGSLTITRSDYLRPPENYPADGMVVQSGGNLSGFTEGDLN